MKTLPLLASCLLTFLALPVVADPWKDESGHGRGHEEWRHEHGKHDHGYDDSKYEDRYDDRWSRDGERRRVVRTADPVDAAIGGAIGGALGGALGAELGGREGAIIGAGAGAAAGAAIATKKH